MKRRGLWMISCATGLVVAVAASCAGQAESGSGGAGAEGGSATTTTFTTSSSTVNVGGQGGFGGKGIAAACETDGECGPGLGCLLDTTNDAFFGGGPAGGFCTRSCDGAKDCPEPGATCLQNDPTQPGRCTLSCTVGPALDGIDGLFTALDPTKCHGREDLRCGRAKEGVGVCLPTCGSDAQCHGGRACDPRLSVCVDHASTGDALGAACDPTTSETTCGGTCVGFDNGSSMCSSPCVLGGDKADSMDCGGVEKGFCAFHLSAHGAGDVGHCTPSCEAQADCQLPEFFCFDVPSLSEISQRGYCFAAAPCPNGQGDCDALGLTEDICTETKVGALCLDPSYPIDPGGTGDAGTADAGAGGAGGTGTGGQGPVDAGAGGSGGTGP